MDCTNLMPVVTIEVTKQSALAEIIDALAAFVEAADKAEGASVTQASMQGSGVLWEWKPTDTES